MTIILYEEIFQNRLFESNVSKDIVFNLMFKEIDPIFVYCSLNLIC